MNEFTLQIMVPLSAIDGLGHANNVEYVRWMQEAATAHSEQAGCARATAEEGAVWVVRTHRIEYLRPVKAGDCIHLRTWVEDCRRALSTRRYEFFRIPGGEVVARGETEWVFVEAAGGRPRSIPARIRAQFGVDTDRATPTSPRPEASPAGTAPAAATAPTGGSHSGEKDS